MQPRQRHRIPPIGLDPLARPLWDQRRGDHQASVPESLDLAIQPVAGRPRLLSFRHLVKWAWQRLLRTVHQIPLPEVTAFSSRFDAVIGAG